MHSFNTEFYGTSTVGERGQIVIPSEARNALKIEPGEKFVFAGHGQVLHLIKASEMDSIVEKMHQRFEKELSKVKNFKTKNA